MEILLVIGGLAFALASAGAMVVVRALRRSRLAESKRREETEQLKRQEARHQIEEETRVAAAQEAQRKAEAESRFRVQEEARAAVAQETQRRVDEEARRRSEEEARAAAAQDVQRKADDDARLRAEEKARVAAEQEALCKVADEARRQAEEEARIAAAQEAHRKAAAETRLRAEESARIAAAQEAQRTADDEARLAAEAQRHAEAEETRVTAEQEARRKGEEEARAAAEQEAQRRAEAETSREAEEEICLVAEFETRRKAEDQDLGPETGGPTDGDDPGTETPEALPRARVPRPFRPVPRVAPVVVQRSVSPSLGSQTARDRALPIEVRLVFEKAGFCRVSLLPRRAEGMPTVLVVTGSGDPPELLALQDDWYQDVVLPDTGQLLRKGIEWAESLPEGTRARWSLGGREIYVLAQHDDLSGFVSTPRLILGEQHVVLCVAERLREVRDAIALTGGAETAILESGSGIPTGWAGLRGVLPRKAVSASPDGDILDALRPLAQIEIALEGGIRIERQTWLRGFPPIIRLRGDAGAFGSVLIDGREATVSSRGGYEVPEWDSPGEHNVWCSSGTRTYAVRDGVEEWGPWEAYSWSLGELSRHVGPARSAICGALVLPPPKLPLSARSIVIPTSSAILVGAVPGEIEICVPRKDVRTWFCVGYPRFEPIWAISADLLWRDKSSSGVLLIGSPGSITAGEKEWEARKLNRLTRSPRKQRRKMRAWCAAITVAGNKGLQVESNDTEIVGLWSMYKQRARTLRRKLR